MTKLRRNSLQRIKGDLGGLSPLLEELQTLMHRGRFENLILWSCEENLDPSRRYRLVEKLLSKNSWVPRPLKVINWLQLTYIYII